MFGRMAMSMLAVGAGLVLVAGLMWFVLANAGPANAAPEDAPPAASEKKNCPAGFHWERYPSPVGCVQTQLPAHGKIGFDGHGICEDGYVGDIEQRPTTDGEPAPGSPYTSFPYLHKCFTADEYAKLQAAGQLPSQAGGASGSSSGFGPSGGGPASDAAEELYEGGRAPSAGEIAGLTAVGLGAVSLATWGLVVVGSPPGGATMGAGYAREKLRQMIEMELRNEQADMEAFKKLDAKLLRLEMLKMRIDGRLNELYKWLNGIKAKIGRSDIGTWSMTILGALVGWLLGGPLGTLAGVDFALTGQLISAEKGDLQDLRVAVRVAIERLEQKYKQVGVEIDDVGLQRQSAMNKVKNTRERLDFLESAWKKYDYGDPGYTRQRPELPGDRPFWDL